MRIRKGYGTTPRTDADARPPQPANTPGRAVAGKTRTVRLTPEERTMLLADWPETDALPACRVRNAARTA